MLVGLPFIARSFLTFDFSKKIATGLAQRSTAMDFPGHVLVRGSDKLPLVVINRKLRLCEQKPAAFVNAYWDFAAL
jgi:hypothetical protein